MKSSETKVASSSHQSHKNDAHSPFFKKDGEGTFFSEGATDMVSPKRAEPFFSPSSIQPKLTIGQPNDKYEKEADATADRVVQQISNNKSEASSKNNSTNNNTSTIQAKPVEESLQAKEKEGEEISMKEMDIQRKPIFESAEDPPNDNNIQRQTSDTSTPTPSADFQSQLNASKGGGSSMSSGTQSSMESAFGNDFSSVKIHNDSNASDMSQSIGAQAFTHGSDIYFNEGKYDEGSTEGKKLLAHELTHTVQQGEGKTIRRQNNAPNENSTDQKETDLNNIKPHKFGRIVESEGSFKIILKNFPVKKSYDKDKGIQPPFILPKSERENKHVQKWKDHIKPIIQEQLKEVSYGYIRGATSKRYRINLKRKRFKDYGLIGSFTELVNLLIRPGWNMNGRPETFQIEHIIDDRLANGDSDNKADSMNNLYLLASKANAKLGGRVGPLREKRVNPILNYYKGLWSEGDKLVSNFEAALEKYNIEIESVKRVIKVPSDSYIKFSQFQDKKKSPINKNLIEINNARIPEGKFLLKTAKKGPGLLLSFKQNEYASRSYVIKINWDDDEKKSGSIDVREILDFKNLDIKEDVKKTYPLKQNTEKNKVGEDEPILGEYIASGLQSIIPNKLELAWFSEISNIKGELDTFLNLTAKGKVNPSISFLKGMPLDFSLVGSSIQVERLFTSTDLKEKLPKPFKLENAYLLIGVSSGIGIYADGSIYFNIPNVGNGSISAKANKKGFEFSGNFDFDSEIFDKASLEITYDSFKDREGIFPWSVVGELTVGEDKLNGIKSLNINIGYENEMINGSGDIEINVPGFEGTHTIEASYSPNGAFSLNTEIAIPERIPGIKAGSTIQLGIAKNVGEADYSLIIGGKAKIDILGFNETEIDIYYENGAILIRGKVPYHMENPNASGEITLSISNQKVDKEGNPTGKKSNQWTAFGDGKVTVELGKGIAADVEVKLQPNEAGDYDIIVSGNVGLSESLSQDNPPARSEDFEKELFKISPPSIILFVIPPIGASLTLGIEGGAKLFASYTPPYFKELSIGLEGFNLTNPDDDFEINGEVSVGMSAKAGLEASLTLKATLSVLVAAVEGRLTGAIGLEANAEALASIKAKWSKANGFEIEEGMLSVLADARFVAKLKGGIKVYLDLWLAEIDIWEEELEIASIEFGDAFKVGMELPISMKDGELQMGQIGKDSFKYPDINNTQKQQDLIKEGASQDEKVKPPPPPSKEEAVWAVKRLRAGPMEGWDVFTMDADEAKSKVTLGWISRDTYIMWLKHKHSTLDWSEPIAVGKQKDRADFEALKSEILQSSELREYQKIIKIGRFSNHHYLFEMHYGHEVTNLIKELHTYQPVEQDENTEIDNPSMTPEVQTKLEDSIQTKGETSNNFESQLDSEKGKGKSLPKDTQQKMGSAFGKDFSNVKIHDDASAENMNKEIGAKAFTHGSDIYFNKDKYDTESKDGQELLAHELTHTVQQGNTNGTPSVQKEDEVSTETPTTDSPEIENPQRPSDAIDITHRFAPNAAWQAYLDFAGPTSPNREVQVPVKIGSTYHGNIYVRIDSRRETANRPGRFILSQSNRFGSQYLDVNGMDFLNPLREAGIHPVLILNPFGEEGQVTGFLSVRVGTEAIGNAIGLIRKINENLEAMNFLGLEPIVVPGGGIENTFENGRLVFQVNELTTTVDGFLEMGGGIGIIGNNLSFNLNTNINIDGLASGAFTIARDETGALNGRAIIEADIANVHATIEAEYLAGVITIQGTGQIQSEKFNGSITLLVTDSARSRQMMHAALGLNTMEQEAESTEAPETPKTLGNQVLAGWGEVTATITPWLEGTAKVGIDAQGHVTMIGELTVPDEIELMEQRGKKVDLFKVEIRAGYGIPLVGQVFLFASVGMFINAGFGPLVLRDIRLEGTYSTDPSVLQQFSISGALAINAFAVLGLEAEAGVGLTLIGHDIKAGVNVTAAAGLRAYALARPTFEYAESQAPEGGKVGEAHLRGHFEAAAQLFMQLSGALFYELDSPWWSPAPDGREESPLGDVQYPIGDSMGIGADLDWLVGSPDVPEIEFSPVEFDPEQFTADVMADPPPNQRGNSEESPEGEWIDGNAEGNLENQPTVEEGGEGIPRGGQQEENLRNLPDEQKYMRGLSDISDIADSREKPTIAVVRSKINRIRGRYGLDQVQIRDQNDEQVKIFVRHARQDNGNHLVEVPIMSEAERVRLLHEAMRDLDRRMEQGANEEGKLSQNQASSLSENWHNAHPVIESSRVIDGGDSWDFQVDIGDRNQRVPGKGKAEVSEIVQDPNSNANENLDPQEKERRIREGLDALAQEERQYLDSGAITKEEAEQVVVRIKMRFPIFTSLEVEDGGDTWDYYYTASSSKVAKKTSKEKTMAELGQISEHGKQGTRPRPKGGNRLFFLESEHIIPFKVSKHFLHAISTYLPERGRVEDNKQTTIMIYELAARIKTPEDNRASEKFKQAIEKLDIAELFARLRVQYESGDIRAMEIARGVLAILIDPLLDEKKKAVQRTNNAINEDFAKNGKKRNDTSALPIPSKIEEAADKQFDDIIKLITQRLLIMEKEEN